MNRSRVLRSLACVVALAAILGRVPVLTTPSLTATAGATSLATHQSLQGTVLLYGTLAALHPAMRTGDLALPDGMLLPLRFTLTTQLHGLRVGDELAVGAEAHDHARLLVRMIEQRTFSKHWHGEEFSKHWRGQDFSKHWRVQDFSKHWRNGDYSKHWRIHGVVARTLGHGDVEVLGVNGAAAVVQASELQAADAAASGLGGGVAYAAGVPAIRVGEEIDAQVRPVGPATVTAETARIIVAQAPGMDVEGRVTALDRVSGTLTLIDENCQTTRVMIGGRAAGYRVGQSVEAWGLWDKTPSAGATTTLVLDTVVEHEDAPAAMVITRTQDGHGSPTASLTSAPSSTAVVLGPTVPTAASTPTGTATTPTTITSTQPAATPTSMAPAATATGTAQVLNTPAPSTTTVTVCPRADANNDGIDDANEEGWRYMHRHPSSMCRSR